MTSREELEYSANTPPKIFLCYAREDENLLQGLAKQLGALKQQGLLDVWYDRNIYPGMNWEQEIDKNLQSANIILFLVSPDFLNSGYCSSVEMKRAMERLDHGEADVIPIILRPVHWKDTPFGTLQALPKDAKPITNWYNRENAFFNVAEGIRKFIDNFMVNNALQIQHAKQQVPTIPASKIKLSRTAGDSANSTKNEISEVSDPLIPSLDKQKWSKEEIFKLKHLNLNPTALVLLNLTAERAGEWVGFDEVCRVAGRTSKQAKEDLKKFTIMLKHNKIYDHQRYWPAKPKRGRPGKPMCYRMSSDIAQWWKEA